MYVHALVAQHNDARHCRSDRKTTVHRVTRKPLPLAVACCMAAALGAPSLIHAGEIHAGDEETFAAHLAAGEFAPAMRIARAANDPRARDARLAQLARAQADAGAVNAFVETLSQIQDDRIRGAAVGQHLDRSVLAQFGGPMQPGGNVIGADAPPGGGNQQGGVQFGPNIGNQGGGAQADFDELIDLIISTVEPTSWEDVGGPGTIREYAGGVYVDPSGMLSRLERVEQGGRLSHLRLAAARTVEGAESANPHRVSPLRKVSLPRLERAVQLRLAAGRAPGEAMRALAGLQRIDYVLVYPETGDIVLAGPAGPWRRDRAGRLVSDDDGRPVLLLDDLVVLLRAMAQGPGSDFGCSITPTSQGLARARAVAQASAQRSISIAARDKWLEQLRAAVGVQEIETYGVPPESHVGRVIVEADYHMKLVGIGLAETTPGLPNYLDLLVEQAHEGLPALDVLRWWFTLDFESLQTTPDGLAYALRGSGVRLQSENELLTELGKRMHTGAAEPINREFAHQFTQHFEALTKKYGVYAELQNVFALALAAALVQAQGLDEQVGWHQTCFLDEAQYVTETGIAPTGVDTIMNYRTINRRQVVAVVSGGVSANPWQFVKPAAIAREPTGQLDSQRHHAQPENVGRDIWWWD